VRDDEPAAFCRAIRDRLVGSLTLYCGDRAVAEELAQEALVRAWERWDRVSTMASPEAWTYRTAFNLASSWGRRRSAERRANRRSLPPTDVVDLPDTSTIEAVRAAVAALPTRQRAVVVCRFYLAMTVAEAAETLGCAPGTIKSATNQALANLRATGLVDEREEVDAR
jgi:RNA polymerase sigma-70 factor (ECF subfamily)